MVAGRKLGSKPLLPTDIMNAVLRDLYLHIKDDDIPSGDTAAGDKPGKWMYPGSKQTSGFEGLGNG